MSEHTASVIVCAATDIANSGIPIKVGMALTAHKTVTQFHGVCPCRMTRCVPLPRKWPPYAEGAIDFQPCAGCAAEAISCGHGRRQDPHQPGWLTVHSGIAKPPRAPVPPDSKRAAPNLMQDQKRSGMNRRNSRGVICGTSHAQQATFEY